MLADGSSRSRLNAWAFGIAAFVLGLAVVVLAGLICFPRIGASLFFSWDSALYVTHAKEYLESANYTGLIASYTQSFGNLAYPTNFNLLPPVRLAYINGQIDPVAMYVLASALFFIATFGIVMATGFGPLTALVSGLTMVLLTMPFTSPTIYTDCFWWDSPSWIPLVYMFAALLVTFRFIGRLGVAGNLLAILLLCCEIFSVIVGPAKAGFLVLFGVAWFCAVMMIAPNSQRELAWKTLGGGAVALFVLLTGSLDFIHGLYAYTGNMLFPLSNLETSEPLALLKIFFGEGYLGWLRPNLGIPLTFLAMLGVIWTTISPPTPMARRMAIAILTISPVLPFFLWGGVIAGAMYPLLVMFAVVSIIRSIRAVYLAVAQCYRERAFSGVIPRASRKIAIVFSNRWVAMGAIATIAFGLTLIPRQMMAPNGFRYPPSSHPLIDRFATDIRFRPGDQFRGRYLDMSITIPLETGVVPPNDVLTAGLMKTAYDHALVYGNDLTIFGPRFYDIPVASEANRMNTPLSVLFHSFLMIEEGQRDRVDYRNITHFDLRLFRLLGIRYVLSHRPLKGESVSSVDIPRLPAGTALYEIGHVNIGQYSPTAISIVPDWRMALEKMASTDFDPTRMVLMHDDWLENAQLTPAREARIVRTREGYRVTATSAGRSLLVLPFEFSRCLVVSDQAGATRIGRVDFLFTGMVFEKKMDTELRFRFGPFENSGCRLADMADIRAMNLNAASFAAFRKKYPNRFDLVGVF